MVAAWLHVEAGDSNARGRLQLMGRRRSVGGSLKTMRVKQQPVSQWHVAMPPKRPAEPRHERDGELGKVVPEWLVIMQLGHTHFTANAGLRRLLAARREDDCWK